MSALYSAYRRAPASGYSLGYTRKRPRKRQGEDAAMVWPWAFLGAALVPVLIFMASTAIFGGTATQVASSTGGTVSFGETFHYRDGFAVSAAVPRAYQPVNERELGRGQAAVAVTFTVTNGTDAPVSLGLFSSAATFNGAAAAQLVAADAFPSQEVAPGASAAFTQVFKVPPATRGPFQVKVAPGWHDPVFFTMQPG